MKYKTAGSLRTALEHRLLDASKKTGLPLTRLRKAVVFERILARLIRTASGQWVLKGAVALEFRRKVQTRATKDLDLGYSRTAGEVLGRLQEAARLNLPDGFVFSVEKALEVPDDDPGAVRFLVRAEMAGRTFEEIRVDVAFADPLVGRPEQVRGPGLLSFARIAAPVIPALPLEQHVAEKVHAYTRIYRSGELSTRSKDLIDLVLIGSFARFEAGRLQKALKEIFAARGTHALPLALPTPPSDWRTSYRRMATQVGVDEDLSAGHQLAARLLDPVLAGTVRGTTWNPATFSWNRALVRRRRRAAHVNRSS